MVAPTAEAAPAPEPVPGSGAGSPPASLDFASLIPERSAQDVLAGEVHLRLGGTEYVLPVLPIAPTRRWLAGLAGTVVAMLDVVEDSGDDLAGALGALAGATDQMTDAVYAYDTTHVLPPREVLEEQVTSNEITTAALTLWAVANPFVLAAISGLRSAATAARLDSGSSTPTNGARPPTGGRRRSSSRS